MSVSPRNLLLNPHISARRTSIRGVANITRFIDYYMTVSQMLFVTVNPNPYIHYYKRRL
jgi:hypothetical protein